MAIDWDADLLAPVMGLFGEGVSDDPSTWPLYTPAGGAAFQLPDAVFDRAYTHVELNDDGSGASTVKPCLGVRLAHFTARGITPKQGDAVYIPSVALSFVVSIPEPDGHGHAKLMLMKQ